jgi:hypothetical protein
MTHNKERGSAQIRERRKADLEAELFPLGQSSKPDQISGASKLELDNRPGSLHDPRAQS